MARRLKILLQHRLGVTEHRSRVTDKSAEENIRP
jgi:hypothetical protein